MEDKNNLLKIFKQVAGTAFVLSFLFAIVVFTNIGMDYIPKRTAKLLFVGLGGIAILFNLLSFERGKHNPTYSFVYWTGVLVTFFGLVAKMFLIKYNSVIMIAGMVILASSFAISAQRKDAKTEDDLLDS